MNSKRQHRWVCVAAVAAAHGIRGGLKLKTFTERPEDVAAYGPLFDRDGKLLFSLTVISAVKGGVIARADSVEDRNAAEELRGTELFVPRFALPDPDEDEFYHADIEGLEAFYIGGDRLGIVKRVSNHGAGDLLEIADGRGRLHILPFDKASVPLVDLENRRLEVTLRPEVVAEDDA